MDYKAILSNQDLFDAFKRGDQRAFTKIYEAFKKMVYAVIIRMVRSPEDAEDLTVQAFTRVWEHRATMESMAHLKNFLFISARNSAIDYLRARRHSKVELTPEIAEEIDSSNESEIETDVLFAELVQDILALIQTMPKVRGKVFRMRFLEELSAKEVADHLDLSIHGVYWHTKEGVAQVRETLTQKAHGRSKVFLLFLLLATSAFIREFF
jgi:RNA polymerase sigma-70 factor (ECF subfamily)